MNFSGKPQAVLCAVAHRFYFRELLFAGSCFDHGLPIPCFITLPAPFRQQSFEDNLRVFSAPMRTRTRTLAGCVLRSVPMSGVLPASAHSADSDGSQFLLKICVWRMMWTVFLWVTPRLAPAL